MPQFKREWVSCPLTPPLIQSLGATLEHNHTHALLPSPKLTQYPEETTLAYADSLAHHLKQNTFTGTQSILIRGFPACCLQSKHVEIQTNLPSLPHQIQSPPPTTPPPNSPAA